MDELKDFMDELEALDPETYRAVCDEIKWLTGGSMHDPLDEIEIDAIMAELEAMDYVPDDDCHRTYWEEWYEKRTRCNSGWP